MVSPEISNEIRRMRDHYDNLLEKILNDPDVTANADEIKKKFKSYGLSVRTLSRITTIRQLVDELESRLILDPDNLDCNALGHFVYKSKNPGLAKEWRNKIQCEKIILADLRSCPILQESLSDEIKTSIADGVASLGWDDARYFLESLGDGLEVHQCNGDVVQLQGLSHSHLNELNSETSTRERVEKGLAWYESQAIKNGANRDQLLCHVCAALRSQQRYCRLARTITEEYYS